jgi:hypothetical protein
LTAVCPHVYEQLEADVRAQLGEATFAAAWDEGRETTLEDDWEQHLGFVDKCM